MSDVELRLWSSDPPPAGKLMQLLLGKKEMPGLFPPMGKGNFVCFTPRE
jgi:hypothetical protein